MEKLYASKNFLKVAGGRMHNPHPTPLNPLLAINCRNHQKSVAYFSHLAPLVVLLKYAPALGNAKIFPQLMFKSRGLAKKSKSRLQPLLVLEIID